MAGTTASSGRKDRCQSLASNLVTVVKVNFGRSITTVGGVDMVVHWTMESITGDLVEGLAHTLHQKEIDCP